MDELETIKNLADEEITLLELIEKVNDLCGYDVSDFASYEELLESGNLNFTLDNDLTINVEFTVVRLDKTAHEESDIVVSEVEIV